MVTFENIPDHADLEKVYKNARSVFRRLNALDRLERNYQRLREDGHTIIPIDRRAKIIEMIEHISYQMHHLGRTLTSLDKDMLHKIAEFERKFEALDEPVTLNNGLEKEFAFLNKNEINDGLDAQGCERSFYNEIGAQIDARLKSRSKLFGRVVVEPRINTNGNIQFSCGELRTNKLSPLMAILAEKLAEYIIVNQLKYSGTGFSDYDYNAITRHLTYSVWRNEVNITRSVDSAVLDICYAAMAGLTSPEEHEFRSGISGPREIMLGANERSAVIRQIGNDAVPESVRSEMRKCPVGESMKFFSAEEDLTYGFDPEIFAVFVVVMGVDEGLQRPFAPTRNYGSIYETTKDNPHYHIPKDKRNFRLMIMNGSKMLEEKMGRSMLDRLVAETEELTLEKFMQLENDQIKYRNSILDDKGAPCAIDQAR